MVVLRHNTSPSPELSLVKRVLPVEVTALILEASPKTAAAVARQKSMSKPFHVPLSSGYANPAIPVLTTQRSSPRDFTSSRVPADTGNTSAPIAIKASADFNSALIFFSFEHIYEFLPQN